jgi:hypothetical protein
MKKDNLEEREKQELVRLVDELQSKLKKKKLELYKTRVKLNSAKSRLRKMKDTVMHQRNRILELYNDDLKIEFTTSVSNPEPKSEMRVG